MIGAFHTHSLTEMLGMTRNLDISNPIKGMQQVIAAPLKGMKQMIARATSGLFGQGGEELNMERGRQAHQVTASSVENIQSGVMGTLNEIDAGAFEH